MLSGSINGNCPECGKTVPALRLFTGKPDNDKPRTTVNLIQASKQNKPKNEKIKRYEMKAGIYNTNRPVQMRSLY